MYFYVFYVMLFYVMLCYFEEMIMDEFEEQLNVV